MKSDGCSDLSLAIFIRDAIRQPFLWIEVNFELNAQIVGRFRTLLRTDIEAYEFPKLIPTTASIPEPDTSFGTSPLGVGALISRNVECGWRSTRASTLTTPWTSFGQPHSSRRILWWLVSCFLGGFMESHVLERRAIFLPTSTQW